MKTIFDTGPLIAYFCEGDEHHAWSVATLENRPQPLLDLRARFGGDGSPAELLHQPTEMLFELLPHGALRVAMDLETELQPVAQFMAKYSDRRIDLADACLIRLSELFPAAEVVTVDRADFQVYRRRERKVVPFLAPP